MLLLGILGSKMTAQLLSLLDLEFYLLFSFLYQYMSHLFMTVTLVLAALLSFKLPGIRLRKRQTHEVIPMHSMFTCVSFHSSPPSAHTVACPQNIILIAH